jgi:hypothetical protein
MKAYKVELLIIDFDEVGEEDIKIILENTKYPNHCFNPYVIKIKSSEIGTWHDDHPLSKVDTWKEEYNRIFN